MQQQRHSPVVRAPRRVVMGWGACDPAGWRPERVHERCERAGRSSMILILERCMKTQRGPSAGRRITGRWAWTIWFLGLCLAVGPGAARAQSTLPWNPKGLQLTRVELDSLLARYDAAANSTTYSSALRKRAASEADMIRARLREGDFHVGDRIKLAVEGETELDTTFAVSGNSTLHLPVIGDISLKGVLRSELQPYLTGQLSKYIKNPQVTAQSLMRIGVLGDVNAPGYYIAPSTAVLSDLLMQAGGPGATADLKKLTIQRGNEVIWSGEALQTALAQSRTLDQLNLQGGDQLSVPAKSGGIGLSTVLGIVSLVVTTTLLIIYRRP